MDKYDWGMGLLQGLNQGIRSYNERKGLLEERAAREKELANQLAAREAERASDRDFQREMKYADRDLQLQIAQMQLEKSKNKPGASLTPAQEAADKTFGKEYADYEAGGGRTGVEKNLGLLQSGIDDLAQPGKISGGVTGYLPFRSVQDYFNPKMAKVRDKLEGAIQGTLRQVLGAQFTQAEGERIMNRIFNPRLSDEENMAKAKIELDSLRAMADNKEAAAKYYRENGTLAGFVPNNTRGLLAPKSMPSSDPLAPNTVQGASLSGEDQQAIEWANSNPNDPRAAAIKKRLGVR